MSTSNPTIPGIVPTPHIFTGENYQTWSVKMQTFLQAHGMWGVVEGKDPYVLPDNPIVKQMKYHETETAKAFKALSVIQNNVSEVIFNLIMTCKTPKEAWDMLKAEFEGSNKVRRLQVTNLRRQFENLKMKDDETVRQYSERIMTIINKMRLLGSADISQERIVMKLVDTLPAKYEAKLSSLEDTRDMSTVSLSEIVNALQAFEQRQAARDQDSVEGAFSVKGKEKAQSSGKGKKIQKKGKRKKQESSGDSTCSKCNQKGHMEKVCKNKQQQHKRAQVAEDDENQEEQMFVATCIASTSSRNREEWLVDSGSTHHMVHNKDLFRNVDLSYNSKVIIGNGEYLEVKGKGDIVVSTPRGNKVISDVLYVPEIDVNLISVGQLLERGYKSFSLKWKEPAAYAAIDNDSNLWHMRLGHVSNTALVQLQKHGMMLDLPKLATQSDVCEVCQLGKKVRVPFPLKSSWRVSKRLQLVHTDIAGPMRTPSLSKNRYFMLFIDDFSRFAWVFFMKHRSEAAGIFRNFKIWIETQSEFKIKVLRSDNGTEYTSESFEEFLKATGVEHQLTVTYTPQQNGVSERKNRTVMEMASTNVKGYRVFNPKTSKIAVSRDVTFKESALWNWEKSEAEVPDVVLPSNVQQQAEPDQFDDENVDDPVVRGTRSLDEIYNRCSVAVLEPNSFTEASKSQNVNRHKARLVVKGYAQSYGIDYTESFAPVARLDTIRLLLAMAAQNQWRIHQMDVKSAFLNGNLQEEIYVEQPEGFSVKGSEEKIYLLKKALYGLKQAPRAWYERIDSYLIEIGFCRSPHEPTLYVKRDSKGILILSRYVDDLLVCGSGSVLVEKFKEEMEKVFEMSNLGEMSYFLGMEVTQNQQGIFIGQQKFAKEILMKFQMENYKSITTPLNPGEKFFKVDDYGLANATVFRSMIGCLLYLSATRLDIIFSVSLLSRFMHEPTENHLRAAKRVLRYVKGSLSFGVMFSKETVAQSTAEAEYIAASEAVNQAIWLKRVCADIKLSVAKNPVKINVDNQSAIAIAKNPVFHSRTKHIKIKFHYVREMEHEGEVSLQHCPSEEQLADIFTKPLSKNRFEAMRLKLNLQQTIQGGVLDLNVLASCLRRSVRFECVC
ncbi:Integrase, catalytic core [Corchorus capsularis]|uniref:Integrase, catalytic core n=1 Tax=Corchorus capsularis TaxID=210143 RepID=A0A1R3FZC0_COCAP|nr:Integrase, catalytic core [Corchorus capsularis]